MFSRSFNETLAVAAYLACIFILNPVAILTMMYLLIWGSLGRYIVILYILWIYMDKESSERGCRRSKWFRNSAWWRYHRDYFPVRLHKTADLPADKNYFIAIFPHGIICTGALSVFATDLHGQETLYPGIKFYLATVSVNFIAPLFRELIQLFGIISVGRESIDWVLSKKKGGQAVVVSVGGAAEAVYCGRGNWTLFLKDRRGFCKVAITNGSDLVPAIVFGKNDLFEVVQFDKQSLFYKIQHFVKRAFGCIPLVCYGKASSLLPDRVPLDVVVGKPIEVKKNPNPSDEEVDVLHRRFVDELTQLFHQEKTKYSVHPDVKLVIV